MPINSTKGKSPSLTGKTAIWPSVPNITPAQQGCVYFHNTMAYFEHPETPPIINSLHAEQLLP